MESITLPEDLQQLIDCLDKPISVGKKYYASLQHIYPKLEDKSSLFYLKDKVFLGCSIGNPNFLNKKFAALIHYLNQFNQVDVLISEKLYQYSLQVQYDFSPDQALEVAELLASKTKIHQQRVVEQLGLDPICYLNLAPYTSNPELTHVMGKLISLANEDNRVKSIFSDFTQFYLNRVLHGKPASEEKTRISRLYLTYELALSGLLNQNGYHALIYPGRIATIGDTLELGIPFLDDLFRDFHYASVRIYKR